MAICDNVRGPTSNLSNSIYDSAFLAAFGIVLTVVIIVSMKTLKKRNNRTPYIILTIIFVILTILGTFLIRYL